jgi:hypothetical protein
LGTKQPVQRRCNTAISNVIRRRTPGQDQLQSCQHDQHQLSNQLEGVLDDPAWADIEPTTDLHQIDPIEFEEPTALSEIWVTYNQDYLYVAAQLHDLYLIIARQLVQGRAFFFPLLTGTTLGAGGARDSPVNR